MHLGDIQGADKTEMLGGKDREEPHKCGHWREIAQQINNPISYQVLQGPHKGSTETALVQFLGIS